MLEGLGIPSWVGSVPQWGMFFLLLIAVVRTSPQWLESLIKAAQERRNSTAVRIRELEAAVIKCQEDCTKGKDVLQDEINDLQDALHGLRKQHIQEQISFINAIITTVDAPELKILLRALQAGKSALEKGAGNEVQHEGK